VTGARCAPGVVVNIPLFPLQSVLFPGGRMPLKVFEPRYMDMAKVCIRDGSPFGVCLLASGHEVIQPGAAPARPHEHGTLATIAEWDTPQLGVLQVTVEGGERFRLTGHSVEPSGLLRGEVETIATPAVVPVPGAYARLIPLLRAIVEEMTQNGAGPAQPHRFYDAGWVGMRYAEVLPVTPAAKQKLLEVDDGIDRLEIVYRFLESKGLLPEA
jgi:uncharacterized protein